MLKQGILYSVITLLFLSLFAACSNKGEDAVAEQSPNENSDIVTKTVSTEPVTLKLYRGVALTDQDFKDFIADPVHKKYPNITMEMVVPTKGVTPESLIASGDFPDIVYQGVNGINIYLDLNVPIDLAGLAKQNSYDLNKFNAKALSAIKNYSDKGQLLALPFSDKYAVLFYNKDIFDKFAVPFPKDRMIWEDIIELGKRVARMDGGVQYKAIYYGGERNISSELSLSYVDLKTGKAALTTDGWKRVLGLTMQMDQLPGNLDIGDYRNTFYKDQTLAMVAASTQRIGELVDLPKQEVKFNWDMAAYPNFKDKPGIAFDSNPIVLMISSKSKYQEQAFQAISVVTSEENQLNMTRNGTLTVLKDQKIKEAYGANIELLKNKNVKGIFTNDYSDPSSFSKYDSVVREFINNAIMEVGSGQSDINTALREAEEKANQAIAEKK
jgi:multiple sugar transport system substrate-binding protein